MDGNYLMMPGPKIQPLCSPLLVRFFAFLLVFFWLFAGWPQIFNLPLSIPEARAAGESWYSGSPFRVKITVDFNEVDANLTNFPVLVDLADLPAGFFTNVASDGGDIRVTNSGGLTELPREVVAINTGGSTGELWFKADSLSTTANTDFYIYYGGGGQRAGPFCDLWQ